MMSEDEKAVRAAVDRWFAALNAMLAGDPEPFATVFSRSAELLYMSGEGTYRVGFDAAFADWRQQAAKSLGGRAEPEDVRVVVSGDMAAVGLVSRATVETGGGSTKEIRFRHSNVFRREGGEWMLLLHHADNSAVWASVIGR